MPDREPELVLRLFAEGGMLEIFRRLDMDGSWRFTESCTGSGGFDLSDFRDDESVVTPAALKHPAPTLPTTFATIEDAIANSSEDGSWVRWMVSEIHPDYVQKIWQFRERTIEAAGEPLARHARQEDDYWAHVCGLPLGMSKPQHTTKLENPNAQ